MIGVAKRIVIVSDCSDVAYNEMRATILSELGDTSQNISVEPLVKAKEFSIENGSFLVRLMGEVYDPSNTIFLVVLNSLRTNRKDRARIIGETKNGFKFVGANTGTLNWLIKDFGLKNLYELNASGLMGKDFISFGGKHVHSPAVAKVAKGVNFSGLGEERSEEFLCDYRVEDGCVVHIDNFGVLKINGSLENLEEGDKLDIFVNGERKIVAVFSYSMKDLEDSTWAIYPGSSLNNLPEIGKVRELSSAKKLGAKIGDIITWKKI
ncbi:hypothetical protein HOG16_02645 [Candidatus Woesearchaeota archaeon]|jgi:S-adenosylmethionine hydrolase|nr:hypothetical protein [Candidatus Woesearchaeota archaeon]MBT4321996.1 hypothetical protein [Candidatus Woesearchaeota archaeon]MBT4630742.1 hypothetical protein [Candidatus Woesearchaeota archaeon]